MAKDYAKALYGSAAWKRCRKSYISKRISEDGGLCEECRTNQGFIVHHKIAIDETNTGNAEITLNFENLMYVCKSCHDAYEGHGAGGHGKAKALCTFDAAGQPISLREIDRENR